ncbi:MAG: hypothetical protein A2312_00170 [Candidatus Staskawiczbacteria bacterium RIFOXYB2_FULL_32_9]|uniref:Uncharacterized protein n=1 Tax=Candidatus Staskawiczbacteria bacterium RIFOXYD1_FULL_32_13 TaxID=1802234 RepID=A0A1G2JNG2_9BACT|nr:MAG: hypothetical protein UR22_C0006G0049 [Parcubacteria group bacterium GW2011_GWC2_32_10]OGJ50288.1 MAG: hypothetical protein A2229_03615 [Candidatus Peregrinibacteria bacterium RIFOXYA2_FULL_33_7]OGZ78447.1 MAG: hypothetical protein A2360_04055 [Candidatus Staskawiczbacteria bacterium RIFOXYB1_FULL_32_11]OGZ84842.1 MAG: hypothetical protein A2312_00170 [Candidatus Staskawiczbacteria bacterium RIFOXYB2_FULL_32_9]OGZ87981.1 MAG: hypothetical protein A2561_02715 [Candidatus Staskawiczbacteri
MGSKKNRGMMVSMADPERMDVGGRTWVVFEPFNGTRRVVQLAGSLEEKDVQFHVFAQSNTPMYLQRYDFVGEFHQGLARACLDGRWFHIRTNGEPAYSQRYDFVGCFFDEDFATARDKTGEFHIRKDGAPAYSERYTKVQSYNGGTAKVSVSSEIS